LDYQTVVSSAIAHYFYPILNGMLIVEVTDRTNAVTLDADTLAEIAHSQNFQKTWWKKKTAEEITKLLQFVKETYSLDKITLDNNNSLELTEGVFGDKLDEFKKTFGSEKTLAFKIPVTIKEVGKDPAESFFAVYIQKDQSLKHSDEYYIRSGIAVCEERQMKTYPVRALLVAEHPAIAKFLGDCEEPAHTIWNSRIEDFKDKYADAAETLSFIRTSMREIVSMLTEPPAGRIDDFYADIFYVMREVTIVEPPDGTQPPEIDVERKSMPFNIAMVAGGFVVSKTKNITEFPVKARVRVAYDTRRKNPFTQYEAGDFDLASCAVISDGCIIESIRDNEIEVKILKSDFRLEVTGFDQNRDLVVIAQLEKDGE
jgi:hypothetical protein